MSGTVSLTLERFVQLISLSLQRFDLVLEIVFVLHHHLFELGRVLSSFETISARVDIINCAFDQVFKFNHFTVHLPFYLARLFFPHLYLRLAHVPV